jgi:hypothetical protein
MPRQAKAMHEHKLAVAQFPANDNISGTPEKAHRLGSMSALGCYATVETGES